MPGLRDLQAAFYEQATGPGLDGGGLFVGRMDVYAEMYFARLHDVLAEQHERLVAALGAPAFRALVAAYLDANRPRSFTISDAGARLPGFLDGALADLARLERLHLELFEAADREPIDGGALAPEELEALPVRMVPSAALLISHWAVDELWDDPTAAPVARTTRLCVWREDWMTICHRRIDDDVEWRALELCAAGTTIGALGALLAADRPIEDAARILFDLSRRIVCLEKEPWSPPPSPASSPRAATPTRPSPRKTRPRRRE